MKSDANIRKARGEDKEAVIELIKSGFDKDDHQFAERYYDKFFGEDELLLKDKVFVAELDNRIVGVIGYCSDYFSTDTSYWLGWFIVAKKCRGQEIGHKLLDKVENELRKYKIKKLFVSAENENQKAKKFYKKHGFRKEGLLRDYYGQGEDQVILGKYL
jgi:ribosomal protein S18 acetylase RimI-like enzyme